MGPDYQGMPIDDSGRNYTQLNNMGKTQLRAK